VNNPVKCDYSPSFHCRTLNDVEVFSGRLSDKPSSLARAFADKKVGLHKRRATRNFKELHQGNWR
jgi:hypothetical protein